MTPKTYASQHANSKTKRKFAWKTAEGTMIPPSLIANQIIWLL